MTNTSPIPVSEDGYAETTATGENPVLPSITVEPATDGHDHTDHTWQPDITALQAAKGDPTIWGQQFAELVGHTTGFWIDAATFTDWLQLFAQQVSQASNRTALLQVANTVVPYEPTGDPSLLLITFRDQLAASFRRSAGL